MTLIRGMSLFRMDTGAMTVPVPFKPPLSDEALDDLRWYLEVFHTWPVGPDYDRRSMPHNPQPMPNQCRQGGWY